MSSLSANISPESSLSTNCFVGYTGSSESFSVSHLSFLDKGGAVQHCPVCFVHVVQQSLYAVKVLIEPGLMLFPMVGHSLGSYLIKCSIVAYFWPCAPLSSGIVGSPPVCQLGSKDTYLLP